MIVLFGSLSLVGGALIFPGWLWVRKRHRENVWLLLLPAAGIGVWVLLTAAGIGAQSLSNVSEVFGVVAAAIVVAYVKLFVFDRKFGDRPRGVAVAFLVVAAVASAFRLVTPHLPE